MFDLEAINVKLSYPMIVGGLCIVGIGLIWLLVRCFRGSQRFARRILPPLLMVLVGLALAAAPPIIGRLVPMDLGPRDRIVAGERHLTLTGWDQRNYSFLPQKSDAVLLQLANGDVDDAVIVLLASFKNLKTLDVSDSRITDQALAELAKLPTLETLYLNRTKVTSAAVQKHLTSHPNLKVIWLHGTGIGKDAADVVKAGKPGRRVMVD